MSFSELSLAERDSGLTYDPERLSLIGKKLGFGAVVTDDGSEYAVKIYAAEPFRHEKEITEGIISLSESLSKNTINSQRCEYNFVEVRLCKSCLLQEKLVLLIDFLDKLTELMKNLGINGAEPILPKRPEEPKREVSAKNAKKIRLRFDFGSIKGLIGALIASFASIWIAQMVVTVTPDNTISSSGTISAYVISAVTTALIFFDYSFLAKKLDPFGVIICPVLSVITAVLSSAAVAAKAISKIAEVSLAEGFSKIGSLYDFSPDAASFVEGYLILGVIISVFASVGICVFYFSRHPEEMFSSEIILKEDDKTKKK